MSNNLSPFCPYCGGQTLTVLGRLPNSYWFAGELLQPPLPGGTLYRCQDCQLKFRYPAHEATTYRKLYDNATITTWSATAARPDWDLIVDHITQRVLQGGRILDFGCYTGGLLARLGNTYVRYGIEINKSAATVAALKGQAQIWPSTNDIPSELRFDAVIVSDVIEHMPNPGHLIDELSALLADGGSLIITTGDADNYLWNRFGANWWYCFYPEHISFISKSWINNFLRDRRLLIDSYQTFKYSQLSITKRLSNYILAYSYGIFPRPYLYTGGILRNIFCLPMTAGVPGNGVSADHLFIVLTKE